MEILNSLIDYVSPTYNQKSKDIFSRLPLDKYKLLLNMYTNQIDINYDDYILFKLESSTSDVEIVNQYTTISDSNTYIMIPKKNHICFKHLDLEICMN